jgi:Flp pilus assembly protein TadB
MFYRIISSVLLVGAVILLLGLTPERITDDLMRVIFPDQTLSDKVRIAQGKKRTHKLTVELSNIREALITTGKGSQFTVVCATSLALFIAGGVFAVMIDNLFLVPIICVALAMIPFVYIKSTLNYYDKHIREEIETALSIVTTSYVRSDDIVAAVSENALYIKPPIRDIFKGFVTETTIINSDVKAALRHLKLRIDNQIYREWCDTLISCQDDRTLKTSLLPVVNKLTDVRIVNNELKTMLYEPRKEYFTMVALVIGNIPLLYMLNKDWYHSLMDTLAGKIILAISGVVVLITAALMMKYTKPVEYKR